MSCRVFPENAVEYFISYYDYYQQDWVPVSDTYIAKTASINEEIDMLRHSATRSLFERRDDRGGLDQLHLRPGYPQRIPEGGGEV